MVEKQISITHFRNVIKRLPSDEPKEIPGIWYKTQKEHWLGWLKEYSGPGAYGRKNWHRDARFVYNHVVCPELIMYLIHAIPMRPDLVDAAEKAYHSGVSPMEKSGAIRKVVPWEEVYRAIWGKERSTLWGHLRNSLC